MFWGARDAVCIQLWNIGACVAANCHIIAAELWSATVRDGIVAVSVYRN